MPSGSGRGRATAMPGRSDGVPSWSSSRTTRSDRATRAGGLLSKVILRSMTHRVGPKGQVVIPKELRDALGIEPGDEVSFWRQDDYVAVRPAGMRRPLRGRFAGSSLVGELERERAADRRREAAS